MSNRVREIRDETGCSLFEAKRIARQERLEKAIDEARSIDDLKPILKDLLRPQS